MEIDENDIGDAEETDFLFNIEKKTKDGFYGIEEVKFADVMQGNYCGHLY